MKMVSRFFITKNVILEVTQQKTHRSRRKKNSTKTVLRGKTLSLSNKNQNNLVLKNVVMRKKYKNEQKSKFKNFVERRVFILLTFKVLYYGLVERQAIGWDQKSPPKSSAYFAKEKDLIQKTRRRKNFSQDMLQIAEVERPKTFAGARW